MPVSVPSLPKDIETKINSYVETLRKEVQNNHVDGSVNISGFSRNGLGARIVIQNLEELSGCEIDYWIELAEGAENVDYAADFSSGRITFDIEYKRDTSCGISCEWIAYPTILSILIAMLQVL
tara:strand:- start:89 stop:457 length:369 start_codon:yes stop_codon:yes gene_type:complete